MMLGQLPTAFSASLSLPYTGAGHFLSARLPWIHVKEFAVGPPPSEREHAAIC